MCSPGRWPPWRRRLQPSAEVAKLLNTILDEAVADYGKDFEARLVRPMPEVVVVTPVPLLAVFHLKRDPHDF